VQSIPTALVFASASTIDIAMSTGRDASSIGADVGDELFDAAGGEPSPAYTELSGILGPNDTADPAGEVAADDLEKLMAQAASFEASMVNRAKEASAAVAAAGQETGEREPLPGMEAKAFGLRQAIDAGDVDPRSALGQRFGAFLKSNPEEAQKYKELKSPGSTMSLKKAFRIKWAESELADCTIVIKHEA
jgi:hypothetical protein